MKCSGVYNRLGPISRAVLHTETTFTQINMKKIAGVGLAASLFICTVRLDREAKN